MPKKTWGIILVCFLALFLVSPKAEAADSGACGEHLSWTLDDAGTLTISGTGDMYDFTYDTQPWKSAQFNTVTIESGVTSIGSHAFDSCRALTRAVIPHSVSRIGNYGFLFCNALRDVTIPNSVISIGTQAFGDCNELTSINIPEGVVEIAQYQTREYDYLILAIVYENQGSETLTWDAPICGYDAAGEMVRMTSIR